MGYHVGAWLVLEKQGVAFVGTKHDGESSPLYSGGQAVYVLPTGALAFTQAHSADTHNGTLSGFVYTPPASHSSNGLGTFIFTGLGAWRGS